MKDFETGGKKVLEHGACLKKAKQSHATHGSLVCHFTRRKNSAAEIGDLESGSPVLTASVHKIQLHTGSVTHDILILLTSKMQFYRTIV